jgi:hypothetical protein
VISGIKASQLRCPLTGTLPSWADILAACSKHLIGFRRDRHETVFIFAPIMLQCMSPLMALNGQISFASFCPLLGKSGQPWILARDGLSANDPTATLAVHCGDGFDTGFSPYRTTLLSR